MTQPSDPAFSSALILDKKTSRIRVVDTVTSATLHLPAAIGAGLKSTE